MSRKMLFIVCSLLCKTASLFAQDVWMIGPMLHVNFGGDKKRVSFGIETAYWNLQHFPYSIDGGFEFEHKRFRLYGELQTGIGLAGVSAGPVLEFNNEGNKVHLGVQTTAWLNYFLGFDYRHRWINHKGYNAVGMYGKIPVATNGLSDNNSHHSHHVDWD